MKVTIDPAVDQDVRSYAQAAVEMAVRHGVTLDFSERSIETVETILDEIARAYATGEVPDDRAWRLSMAWGSYVGQVFVRAHNAMWGVARVEGEDGEVACVTHPNVTFWPWVRAMKRITEGSDNNVWHYYLQMVRSVRQIGGHGA